jgi:hypothetical protein
MKADFRNFLWYCWKHLNLPPPTKRQYAIANFLQGKGTSRKVVKAWRGAAKSWISAAFVVWDLWCRPETTNILVFSASKQRADGFTTFCLRLINEIEILRELRPGPGQRCSMVAFDVGLAQASQTPSMLSIGITGQATGHRANKIIADDVEVPNNSETVTMREKLSERVKEFEYLLKPGGEIIFLGTDQVEDSIYKDLPGRGYTVRIWPARYPTPKNADKYLDYLDPEIAQELLEDPDLAGRPTEPSRFPEQLLQEREASVGQADFERQYLLPAVTAFKDQFPLKLRDLLVMPLDIDMGPERVIYSSDKQFTIQDLPCVGLRGDHYQKPVTMTGNHLLPYEGKVLFIDPAGNGPDETGYAVVASLNGAVFLLDCGGLKGYGSDTLQELARIAKAYKVQKVLVEPNFGDGMFTSLLKPVLNQVYPCSCEDAERARGQKEVRIIDCLGPVMSTHRLVVSEALIHRDFDSVNGMPGEVGFKYRLLYQMSRITRVRGALKHDDRLDALAGAVNYWQRSLQRDQKAAANLTREKALQAELNRVVDYFKRPRGGNNKRVNWNARI